MNARAAVERFLTAFYSGDASATREAVTADFTLEGRFAAAYAATSCSSSPPG
jgi:hypothetical protein